MKKSHVHFFNPLMVTILFSTLLFCSNEEEILPNILRITPSVLEFAAQEDSAVVQLTSNTSWTISDTSQWCRASEISGEGDKSISVYVSANNAIEERYTSVFFANEEFTKEIHILQAGITDTSKTDTTSNDSVSFKYDIPPDNTGMREMSGVDLALEMGIGWNVGNSLEAIPQENSWGNPLISQRLIDSVHAAGFNAIRIPVAWSKFSDEATFTIQQSWKNRVEDVVNYVLNNGMYAIINIHWDEGWMQPLYADSQYVNTRLAAMWKQIATHFRDYDDHLLFAGTNEVHVEGNYGTPTAEMYTVQNGFNQVFVTAVRHTGGRNAYRHLVVQGFNTNIDHTLNFAVIPQDVVEERLMMEVHYYDPYNFTLNENSNISQWGSIATNSSLTETWANEAWADAQFQKMKSNFIDKGYAVLLGEYAAISRTDVPGHEVFRRYYIEYITQSLLNHGLVPFIWDNGYAGNHGCAIFNRASGAVIEPDLIDALMKALD